MRHRSTTSKNKVVAASPHSKNKPKSASCCEKIKSLLMRLILHTIFGPALMIYDCLKKTIKIWVSPVDWLLKKVNPNYVNDVVDKKDRITQSVKRKAGSSILTMSSFIAK